MESSVGVQRGQRGVRNQRQRRAISVQAAPEAWHCALIWRCTLDWRAGARDHGQYRAAHTECIHCKINRIFGSQHGLLQPESATQNPFLCQKRVSFDFAVYLEYRGAVAEKGPLSTKNVSVPGMPKQAHKGLAVLQNQVQSASFLRTCPAPSGFTFHTLGPTAMRVSSSPQVTTLSTELAG
eukprot:3336909-Rhodomonas_salina.1